MTDLLGKPNPRQASHYDCTICGSERIRTDNRKSHRCYKGDFDIFRKCISILGNTVTKGGDNQRTGSALFGGRAQTPSMEPANIATMKDNEQEKQTLPAKCGNTSYPQFQQFFQMVDETEGNYSQPPRQQTNTTSVSHQSITESSQPGEATTSISEVHEEIKGIDNWLTSKQLTKLKQAKQELPDEVVACLITLILFHCNTAGNHDTFAVLPQDIQPFIDKRQEMDKRDIYQAVRRAREFDNATLILIPVTEKREKYDSGHWFLFAIDLVNDIIYMVDSNNQFRGSYRACDEIKKYFLVPYLSYKAEKPGPVDEPHHEKIVSKSEVICRAQAFKTIEVKLLSGVQKDRYSCGIWLCKMILELMVARQAPSTLDFSIDVESYRSYLLRMMQTRNLYTDNIYQHPSSTANKLQQYFNFVKNSSAQSGTAVSQSTIAQSEISHPNLSLGRMSPPPSHTPSFKTQSSQLGWEQKHVSGTTKPQTNSVNHIMNPPTYLDNEQHPTTTYLKEIEDLMQENGLLRASLSASTRSQSADSKFTDSNLGSAASAEGLTLRRQQQQEIATLNERITQLEDKLKKQKVKSLQRIDQHNSWTQKQEHEWKARISFERTQLEVERTNDVRRVQDKYNVLLEEIRERAERAEKELKEQKQDLKLQISELKKDHNEQFARLDSLFQHYLTFLPEGKQWEAEDQRKSATSHFGGSPLGDPVAEADEQLIDIGMPGTMFETTQVKTRFGFMSEVISTSKDNYDIQSQVQLPSTHRAVYSQKKAIRLAQLERQYERPSKTLKKCKSPIVRTPDGSNATMKALRKKQTQLIADTLDSVKHLLPTMKEILEPIWQRHPKQMNIELKAVGRKKVFCDGIGIPMIESVTGTAIQVRQLFARFDLKLQVVVAKDKQWFVKLDEDAMPNFKETKQRLKELSNTVHEELKGEHNFFLRQVDRTRDHNGFLYCVDPKNTVKQLSKFGLKQCRGYHSNSLSLNLEAGISHRVKIYNKTMHPLFATDSVQKSIGSGGRQFFLSSNYSFAKFRDSINTGRTRIEESFYFNQKAEEKKWFDQEEIDEDDFIKALLKYLRKEAEFIKEIPFSEVWDAFWYVQKLHVFVEESHKAAVIYAFNEETKQYIGGLLDITGKKSIDLFHREHSIFNREALVMKGGKVTQRFVKQTNKQCFPIFPRFNPRTHQRHQFIIPGWDYYMDTNDVELIELEVPIHEEESSQSEDPSFALSSQLPQKITVRQLIESGLQAEVVPVHSSGNVILGNHRPAFLALEEEKKESARKRDDKEEVKRTSKAAKEQGRANRDDDMDFFAVYYKQQFVGFKLQQFRNYQGHPSKILNMLKDGQLDGKIKSFIDNQRRKRVVL